MSFTIRLARAEEQNALEALQTRASLANQGDRGLLLANPGFARLPRDQIDAGQVFVAERDGATLGFAAVLDRDDGDTELDGLFTEPESWRAGVGRALVARCAAYARARGARALHVMGNPHAIGFYEKCGFTPVGKTQTPLGPAAPLMRLSL